MDCCELQGSQGLRISKTKQKRGRRMQHRHPVSSLYLMQPSSAASGAWHIVTAGLGHLRTHASSPRLLGLQPWGLYLDTLLLPWTGP